MILSFCDNATVLQVIFYVKIIIKIICIAVPIILIISMLIEGTKTVSSKEADIGDLLKKFTAKIIATILIFLIPTFINIIANVASADQHSSCLKSATKEGILNAKYNEIDKLIERVKTTYNRSDLQMLKIRINQLGENTKKQQYLNSISEIEKTIKKKEEILALTQSTITREKYDEAMKFVETLPDGPLKTSLKEKLEGLKSALTPKINPGGKVGNALSGKNIVDLLREKGSSVEEFNAKIKNAITFAGVGTREAAVAAASTLIDTLAGYGYKINYEWWGKYAKLGIDTRWGSLLSQSQYERDCNNYANVHNNDGSNCWNNMKWYGFDCSGFAQWIVIQAMQNTSASYGGGTRHNFNSSTNFAQCQIGDPIYRSGHVAIIVDLDDQNKTYTIAESSSGVTYNSVGYTDSSWWCNHINIYSD